MKLYDFQSHDLNQFWWKECNGRGILGWEVGLGKTFIGAHVINVFKGRGKRVLVVSPPALVLDWQENCKERGVDLIHYKKGETDFTVCTPATVKKIKGSYDLLIADECHRFKNHGSQQSKAFRKIAQGTEHLLMMSGTISNFRDADELLNYLWCINTSEIKNLIPRNITGYRREYCNSKMLPNGGRIYYSTKQGSSLVDRLIQKHTSFRKLREERSIPVFSERIEKLDCGLKLKDIKERYEKELGIEISEDYENPCVIHQLMLDNGIDYDSGKLVNTGKLERVHEIVEGIGESKALVWFHFREFGFELQKYLTKHGIKSELIIGGMSDKEKDAIIAKHRAGEAQVICASLGTIAEGKNLQYCNYAITANQWFDVIKDTQARGRIERNGQENPMYHVRLVAKGGLEEYVMKVLTEKISKKEANDFLIGVLQKKYGVK